LFVVQSEKTFFGAQALNIMSLSVSAMIDTDKSALVFIGIGSSNRPFILLLVALLVAT
jgi:hypothetical protein